MKNYIPVCKIPGSLGLVVVDATDPTFFPGQHLPKDWLHFHEGTFFFLPENDLRMKDAAAKLRKFPYCYSLSYNTAAEAASAAQSWQWELAC